MLILVMKDKKTKGHSTEDDKIIGNTLRKMRLISGMSQEDLGSSSGVSFQQIQKYENGINRISASRLLKLSKALNVDIMMFYNGLVDKDNAKFNIWDTDSETLKLIKILDEIDDKKIVKSLITILS